MSNRTKIIIILVAGFTAIGLLIWWLMPRNQATVATEEPQLPAKIQVTPEQQNAIKLPPPTPKEIDATLAMRAAKTFVERFATFSNTNGYVDIAVLDAISTPEMQAWLKTVYLPKLQKDFPSDGFFYSVNTMAPSAIVAEQKDSAMKVTVSTERQETKADKPGDPFLQKITVELKKSNNTWLVDAAYWQK